MKVNLAIDTTCPFWGKLLRFTFTGVVTTLLHTLVAVCLISYVHPNQIFANGLAFILTTLFSYGINTHWSFSAKISKTNFMRYIVVTGLGFLTTLIIAAIAQVYNWHYFVGIGLVLLFVPGISFLLHNFWTYR